MPILILIYCAISWPNAIQNCWPAFCFITYSLIKKYGVAPLIVDPCQWNFITWENEPTFNRPFYTFLFCFLIMLKKFKIFILIYNVIRSKKISLLEQFQNENYNLLFFLELEDLQNVIRAVPGFSRSAYLIR